MPSKLIWRGAADHKAIPSSVFDWWVERNKSMPGQAASELSKVLLLHVAHNAVHARHGHYRQLLVVLSIVAIA
ncbi:hypothetical protein [Bradyrhizobium sp. Ash2021]|uniref:hypothetical protein n=1 Tax=Bradyrhizobium sp. Ash2021 TaxID=2954771 RepID=UPI0028166211|nr:hypothetical protein [Bradyrhizobium sp. Ash2021]WMT79671.1 hypothetical protein NL528_45510 [Bradyrhizobium sp. Ash2021]